MVVAAAFMKQRQVRLKTKRQKTVNEQMSKR
jgi:hypothetical protein